MISDSERREAARRLREIEWRAMPELIDGELLDLLARTVGFNRYTNGDFDEGLLGRLADLIDRPTCTVESDTPGFHIGVCSHCGAMVERECAVFDATSALPTRFCPNCGAEVVPHAERRD